MCTECAIYPSNTGRCNIQRNSVNLHTCRPLPDFSDPLLTARTTAAFYTRRKPLSATINTLANALYRVGSEPWRKLGCHKEAYVMGV